MMTEYEEVKPIFDATAFAPVGFGKSLNERLAEHPQGKFWQRRAGHVRMGDHSRQFRRRPLPRIHGVDGLSDGGTAGSSDDRAAGLRDLRRQQRWSWTTLPKGGSGELTQALARFIEAHGGVILTNKPVHAADRGERQMRGSGM